MKENKTHKILILTFLIVLALPFMVQVSGIERDFFERKKIVINNSPNIDYTNIQKTLKEFKSYYSANFGMKTTLFEAYKNFTQKFFNDDPLPSKVITGKNDWLFLGDSDSNAMMESLGFLNFTNRELKQISTKIESRREWLASKNIKYYICAAPSKHTLYREQLPFTPFKVNDSKLKTLRKHLKNEINFDIIDLNEALIQKKDSINLFFKQDTHWNHYGAFLGYIKIMDVIQKDFKIVKKNRINIEEVEFDSISNKVRDLNVLLNNMNIYEEGVVLKIKERKNAIKDNPKDLPPYYIKNKFIFNYERYINPSKELKIIIFRDSFSTLLKDYISETFGESVFIWNQSFNKEIIDKEKPDIVLFEFGERVIEKLNN